jgi:hypothetical protein
MGLGEQSVVDGRWNILLHDRLPALRADQSLHHAGADLRDVARRHEEDAGDGGFEIAVQVPHRPLILEVAGRTDAAQDVGSADGLRVVDEELRAEAGDHHTG